MAGDEIEYLLAGYRFSLKDFLLDEFATSVSTIHDEVLDGNPEGRDEQVWKKILPLTHGLSSYALRVATKFSKLMGLLLRVQNTGTFTDLKNLYVEFGKFLPELQKLRKISGELSKLINTEESLPMMWDNVFSKAHQKLISYDEDYRKHTTRSYVAAEAEIDGIHPRIAEMYFFRDEGRFGNQYPYDLMQVHRYVDPEYRNRRGVGTYLYEQSELWAKQVARKKGMDLRIALSTDQPDTMNWAEKRGYAPYPEEADKRKEVLEHLDRFTLIDESDVGGQARNTAIERDGKRVRLWFEKTIRA
jgi:GNAT superfamily N-acetyltransferase